MAQHEDLQNPFKGCILCCMFVIPTLGRPRQVLGPGGRSLLASSKTKMEIEEETGC